MRSTKTLLMAVMTAGALAATACSTGGTDSAPDRTDAQTLRVSTALTDLGTLPMFVAQSRGLFAKQNLTVDITSSGPTTIIPLLSSGGTDLVQNSNGVAVTQTLKGQPTVVTYGVASYNTQTELWSGSMTTMAEAAAKPDCTLATVPPGAATYGYAVLWKEKFGLHCELAIVQSLDIITAGLRSGSYDLGIVPRSSVGAVPDGVHVLISRDDPAYPGFPGGKQAVIAGLLGLKSTVGTKQEAITRFDRAMVEAQQIVDTADPDDLVRDVQESDIFKAIPVDALRTQIVAARSNAWRDPDTGRPGFISEATWTNSVKTYAYWGMQGFRADDPAVSYAGMVDMSAYPAAPQR